MPLREDIRDHWRSNGSARHPWPRASLSKSDDSQLLNALKCSQLKVGLLINFGESSLKWKRFVN